MRNKEGRGRVFVKFQEQEVGHADLKELLNLTSQEVLFSSGSSVQTDRLRREGQKEEAKITPDDQAETPECCSPSRGTKKRHRRDEDRVRPAERPAAKEAADHRGAAVDLLLPGFR